MYKPCPYCTKKKEHHHKGCNEDNGVRTKYVPEKKKKKDEK